MVTAVLFASAMMTFLWATTNSVSNTRQRVEDRANTLQKLVENTNALKHRVVRTFLFVYDPKPFRIDVGDMSVADWKKMHDHAVGQKKLIVSHDDENPGSWLYDNFKYEEPSYGTAVTPYLANTLSFYDSASLSDVFDVRPDFRLRFANDRNAGPLYILGHLVMTPNPRDHVVMRLTVHNDQLEEKTFRLLFQDNGDFKLLNPDYWADEDTDRERRKATVCGDAVVNGRWWRLDQSEKDWFLELAVQKCPADAVELVVSIGTETATNRIGTGRPLPLFDEIDSYPIVKYLRYLFWYYEIRRGNYVLSRTRKPKNRTVTVVSSPWALLLSPLYSSAFYFAGIDECQEGPGMCFLGVGGVYRLRIHREILMVGTNVPVAVVVEEPIPILFGKDSVVVMGVIILLASLVYYVERRRRRASRSLQEVNDSLERTNERLEQTNKDINSYADTFQHEARRTLGRIPADARRLSEGDGTRLSQIEKCVEDVMQRLWTSGETFNYDKVVRKEIEYHRPASFDLSDSVAEVVEFFSDNDEHENVVENIDFRICHGGDSRPFLGATGLPNNPDHYFRQALEKVIANAGERRDPKNSKIVVRLDVVGEDSGSPQAVLTVSNSGQTVETEKLAQVFDLGTSYDSAGENSLRRNAGERDKEHQGLGLFLTRKIVMAYGGTCQLENLPDNTGVKFIFRLPVTMSAADAGRHSSAASDNMSVTHL